jgi:DNA-binding Lrp family transcriptional regulator
VTVISQQDRDLLNAVQRDFPVCNRPFHVIAERLGMNEHTVITRLHQLEQQRVISRFGAVYKPNVAGASTLVAMAVPERDIDSVAAAVSLFSGVNHNYLREHKYNLWFVLTGKDREALDRSLAIMDQQFGLPMLDLPMQESYHIDLGFSL